MTTAMTTAAMIAIECACGRRGNIASQFAGRKVKCTGCGQPVRVPTASGSAVAVSPRTTPPSSPPSDERLDLAAPASDGLELMPEVTRPFQEPLIARARRAPAGVDDPPSRRGKRRSSGQRRDSDWERHLRAIAIWPLIFGVLSVPGVLLLATLLVFGGAPPELAVPYIICMCAGSAVQLAYGYFLWIYSGTARLVHLAINGLLIALLMFGMVVVPGAPMKVVALVELAWPAAMFAVLVDPRAAAICTASYRTLVARTPQVSVRWWSSPFFYVPILLALLLPMAVIAALSVTVRAGM